MAKLILLTGDQISDRLLSACGAIKGEDTIAMAEIYDEVHYTRHHIKKIVLIFSAMRHFARHLEQQGWRVAYHRYTADSPVKNFADYLQQQLSEQHYDSLEVIEPGEYRLQQDASHWPEQLGIPVHIHNDNRFIVNKAFFSQWAAKRTQLRMEYFYRELRKKTGLLMEGQKPVGGKWNYDQQNRQAYKGKPLPSMPLRHTPDGITQAVIGDVKQHIQHHMGSLDDFWFACDHDQAEQSLQHFLDYSLPLFGHYQDAMHDEQPFLFHSVIALYINLGLIDPLDACQRAEQCYISGQAPLNAVEGFIRQILGWREFIRGYYWHHMPELGKQNALDASRPLPSWYWTGKTRMRCLSQAINTSLEEAYAHHIQRLMVTGNFALLAGFDPEQVHQWYLGIYADAFEWVELPNTLGMALHADGGGFASKPYAASGAYINRMSNYCQQCPYQVKTTRDNDSCPFNALYWDFLDRHQQRFAKHPRMVMMYRNLSRKSDEEYQAIKQRAAWLIENMESL